jgi:hypothetical protein
MVEREKLRLEFEAIIAAGYRGGADEPRPDPPPAGSHVIGVVARPVARPRVPIGTGATGAAASRPSRRARPSRARAACSRPARLLCAPAQLPCNSNVRPLHPATAGGPLASTVDRVRSGGRSVATDPSTAGGCTSSSPARAPARRT